MSVPRRPLGAPIVLACTLCFLLAGITLLGPARAQAAGLSAEFFGMETPEVAFPGAHGGAQYRAATLDRQRATGVGLIRQPFYWTDIEPQQGVYDFRTYDDFVGEAAKRGIRIMPVLFGEPSFYSSRPAGNRYNGTYPPRSASYNALGNYGAALVRRYGPNGSYWAQHPRVPKLPTRSYQVWNEPHLPVYWPAGPSPAQYSQLLRTVSPIIKAADPGAEVVAAGISDSRLPGAIPMRDYIQGMYSAGAAQGFDTLAVHPYDKTPSGALGLVEAARALMVRNGDSASKLWVTEFSWGSGGPPNDMRVSKAVQAEYTSQLLTDLVNRRSALALRGAVYWIWSDSHASPETWASHTGMVRRDGSEKPVLGAFRNVIALSLGLPTSANSFNGGLSGLGTDFVGMNGGAGSPGSRREADLGSQALLGVQVIRQTFDWSRIERVAGRYSLERYDALVARAAARGLEVLPVLHNAPRFRARRARGGARPPRRVRDFQRLATALVNRYGPRGSLWRERPAVPKLSIRAWQIWHQPNSRRGWAGGPRPSRYAALLRGTSRSIKRADPRAEVVTASLATGRGTVAPRRFLARVYRARGRSGFDTVAVRAYARDPRGMMKTVRLVRRLMNRHRDRRARIWISEFGWADRGSKSPFGVGRKGQARRLSGALRAVARERRRLRIRGLVYASWRDTRVRGRGPWRRYTGLLDSRGRAKPAFRAFEQGVRALRLGAYGDG